MDIVRLMLLSRQMKNRRHEKNNMVTGIPPLTFTANKKGLLKNYRIYGNTETKTRSYSGSAPLSFPIVDGAVSNYRVYGQTSRNLFDGEFLQGYWAYANGIFLSSNVWVCTTKIACIGNTAYTFSFNNASRWAGFVWYDANGDYISTDNRYSGFVNGGNFTATSPSNAAYMIVNIASYPNTSSNIAPSDVTNFMLVEGSAALPYEPYGESVGNLVTDSQSEHYGKYAIPITNNSETVNIYLDEPLTKSGDNVDYVDYAEQKRHNADGTSEDVTLPALPAQSTSNYLSVGTIIQPSSVAVDVDELVSVGDKTANLFDMSDNNPDNVTLNEDGSFYIRSASIWGFSCEVETGKTYFLSWEELNTNQNSSQLSIAAKAGYHVGFSYPCYRATLKDTPPNVWYKQYVVFTATDDYLSIDGMNTYIRNIMLVEGSTAMDYELYGYKIPVTITADSAETTDIYLDEPLVKSGDIADYIDYAAQRRYNADSTESSVKLPEIAVAVGTNTLTVGTEVQPSRVELTGRIKEAQTNGSGNT